MAVVGAGMLRKAGKALLSFVGGVIISVMRNDKLFLKYVINYDIN
jgi:hypothetical protein